MLDTWQGKQALIPFVSPLFPHLQPDTQHPEHQRQGKEARIAENAPHGIVHYPAE